MALVGERPPRKVTATEVLVRTDGKRKFLAFVDDQDPEGLTFEAATG